MKIARETIQCNTQILVNFRMVVFGPAVGRSSAPGEEPHPYSRQWFVQDEKSARFGSVARRITTTGGC